ncbi:MAG: hypothetical protein M3R13_10400 [Armatimonadota bacterium]|nr:hypothetical protein [Armatimonadota bacterium]
MTATQLLELVEERGIQIVVEGSELVAKPASRLTAELRLRIKELKPAILEVLRDERRRTSELVGEIDEETLAQMEGLVRALGAEVETPHGRGKLVYMTPHGVVVQVPSGLMYTLDPRKVTL